MKYLKILYVPILLNLIFFIAYGFPLLNDGQDFSHFAIPIGLGSTDLSGAIRMTSIYQSSGFMNFTSNFTNFPKGENLLSIYLMSQISTNFLIQLLLTFSPKIAVMLVQFIFSTITTIAILVCINDITKKYLLSVGTVVFFLVSPFNILNLSAHINGVLWGLPLLILIHLYRKISGINVRNRTLILLSIIIFITDIYLAYTAIFILLSYLISKHHYPSKVNKVSAGSETQNTITYSLKKHMPLAILALLCLFVLQNNIRNVFYELYGNGVFQPAKPQTLGIYEFSLLNIYLVFVLLILILNLKEFSYQDKWLFWTSTLLLSMSINLGSVSGMNLSPVHVLSPFLPNLDHVQRFLPYVVLIYASLVAKVVFKSFQEFQMNLTYAKYLIVFLFIIIFSFRLFSVTDTERVSIHSVRYEEFRKAIPTGASVLAIPNQIFGRDWIQQAYINRPFVNSLNTEKTTDLITQMSVSRPSELRKFMLTKNTSFLIMPCAYRTVWETSRYSNNNLDDWFNYVAMVKDEGYEQGPFNVCLYKI